MREYDVIVVGGGVAGSMAATAAARSGQKVLLIEEEGYLGGSLTASGTGPMMTFHAGEKQVVRGLGEELIARLAAKGLSPSHTPDSTGYTYTVTPFDAEGLKRELELMVTEAGAEILFHAMVIAADKANGRLRSVTAACCGQQLTFAAKCFIDASGDADLIALADIPYEKGRDADGKDQPMTTNMKMCDVDIAAVRALMDTDIALFPVLQPKAGRQHFASRLSCSGFMDAMKQGMSSGELTFDRDIVLFFETNTPGEVIVNMTRVNGENPVDPFSLTRAELEGRRQAWELCAFLRKRIPGFAHARLLTTGPRIGVRSSRRMKGIYRLTARDILNATKFADGIAASGYPIDVHSPDGEVTDSQFLADGAYYTIPYRCLINDTLPNVLAAGRNISTEFEAHASTRVSPICLALGHAAGCAAALAAQGDGDATHVDAQLLRDNLRAQDAVVD